MRSFCFWPTLLSLTIATGLSAQEHPPQHDVRLYGAQGDGATDDAAAFQKALDAVAAEGGGTLSVPRGNYRFGAPLSIPQGVTLRGMWQSVPAHNGIRDRGLPKPTDDGTTFLVCFGAGTEEGPAFITLQTNSTLTGVVIYYPDQLIDEEPQPYPWAIAMRGKNPAVIDVELLNPYNGIDATKNERHLIRNVQGQPLRRGVWVDEIYDIGRIENVHFNPWWSMKPKVFEWQLANGEAFIFGRTDWQYVLNTFCFGYRVGYKFIRSEKGVCNGNFLGIGADGGHTAVEVEDCAKYGLLITNGEFVAMRGPDPTMLDVKRTNRGSVRMVNCAFWGPCQQIARLEGRGTVGLSDCTFCQWDAKNQGREAIQANGGTLIVRGCEFQRERPQIRLGPDVRSAVIVGNVFQGRRQIRNESTGGCAIDGKR